MSRLTPENYQQGFLVDEELMAGVTEERESEAKKTAEIGTSAPSFAAFVLNHASGEYLGYRTFPTLEMALQVINEIPRPWAYERTSGCGNEDCGKSGGCKGSSCKRFPSMKPESASSVTPTCG